MRGSPKAARLLGPLALSAALLGACARVGFAVDAGAPSVDGAHDRGGEARTGGWVALGASATGNGIAGREAIASCLGLAVTAGAAYVGWTDDHSGQRQVYLRRWDGTSWQGLGGSDQGTGLSATVDESLLGGLALDRSGRPVLVWNVRRTGAGSVQLRRWTGAGWEELGGSATGTGISAADVNSWWPDVAVDGLDRPVVAWEVTASSLTSIHLRRWTGVTWEEVAGSFQTKGISGDHQSSLVQLAGGSQSRIDAVWAAEAGQAIHRSTDGSTWSFVTSPSHLAAGAPEADRPRIVQGADGLPVVAWQANLASGAAIYLRRWTGTAWTAVGGSDQGGGVSAGTGGGKQPHIARDLDGSLLVAWAAADSLGQNIYVARWTPQGAVDLSGSTAAGGVSSSRNPCSFPRVAAGPDGVYVIWEEELSATSNVAYLKHLPR